MAAIIADPASKVLSDVKVVASSSDFFKTFGAISDDLVFFFLGYLVLVFIRRLWGAASPGGKMPGRLAKKKIQPDADRCQNSTVAWRVKSIDADASLGQHAAALQTWSDMQKTESALSPHTLENVIDALVATGAIDELLTIQSKSARQGLYSVLKSYFSASNVNAAAELVRKMCDHGYHLPPQAMGELLRIAFDTGEAWNVFDVVSSSLSLMPDSATPMLRECLKCGDLELALKIEVLVRKNCILYTFDMYEVLLKLHAVKASTQGSEVLSNMQRDGFMLSEALAEYIHSYLRSRSMATLSTYKAFLRVYSNCNLHEKCCDLYAEAMEAGVKADASMSACILKHAMRCGRTELTQRLLDRSPDSQSNMAALVMLRSAGTDGNVDRAFELLRESSSEQAKLDVNLCNQVLDICAANSSLARAEQLMKEMCEAKVANPASYCAMVKHYSAASKFDRARELVQEMERAGYTAGTVVYNYLVAALVTAGRANDAWKIIAEMDRKAINADHYTISIMMKASKLSKNKSEIERALALLDRPTVNVCADDILLNTVLDACINGRSFERLAQVVNQYSASGMQASVHTFGLLIKSCSVLQRTAQCKELWHEMVTDRGMIPTSIALSCMMDALVRDGLVEEAAQVFRAWEAKVPPNAVIYSTLIKGYAVQRNAAMAMSIFKEMQDAGIEMNTIAYTTLIDANVRAGDLQRAEELLVTMQRDGCEPNTITFSTLLKGHCRSGDLLRAFGIFNDMKTRGLHTDTIIFNTLLDGCVRHSRFPLADELLVEMKNQWVVSTSFTLSIVIKMWGKRRQLDKAFEAMRTMPKDAGFVADSQTGTCLISACFYNGAFERSLEALEIMKASSYDGRPDANTYSTMITNFARRGLCQQAVELARDACGLMPASQTAKGGPLRSEAVEQLRDALRRRGLYNELGSRLSEELQMKARNDVTCRNFLATFSQ